MHTLEDGDTNAQEKKRYQVCSVLSVVLFIVAGLAEIAGDWLVWQAVRGRYAQRCQPFSARKKQVASVLAGSCLLVGYGFLPTLQPPPSFGRLYAVYGGFFVLLSYLWGWVVDGDKPDKGAALSDSQKGMDYRHPVGDP